MNPQDQLMELLQENGFGLIRQRKHKIYRNPEGLTFVAASTPSDRKAPLNALSTLRRILRQAAPEPEPVQVITQDPPGELAPPMKPGPPPQSAPDVEPETASVSEQEWETWKRGYWRDEKQRAKNERFLSVVGEYVDRASELFKTHERVSLGPVTDAVKQILRNRGYKSKVVLYNCRCFEKGIVVGNILDVPVLWASNGHIGVSATLLINAYVQHGDVRAKTLRFMWNGSPVLLELPEKRKFYVKPSYGLPEGKARESQVECPSCRKRQKTPPLESMAKHQGWKCHRCGVVNKLDLACPKCKVGIIVLTEFFGYCPSCEGTADRNPGQ